MERRDRSGLVASVTLLATLAGVWLWLSMASAVWQLTTGLLESRDQLDRAERHLSAGKLKKARQEILAGEAAADRARATWESPNPLLDVAAAVEAAGGPISQLDHIVAAADLSASAARGTLDVAQNALRGPNKIVVTDDSGDKAISIARLEDFGATISAVRDDLRAAADELRSVDLDRLPRRARPAIEKGIERSRRSDAILADAEAGFELLPAILGVNGPRRYMFGMQNNAELRGTGGAMLRFSTIEIEDGRPRLLGNDSVYQIDIDRRRIDIPLPNDAWYVRAIPDAQRFGNANWSPDWPLTAQLTLRYAYTSEKRLRGRIDGLIAVDPIVMQNLIPGTGKFATEAGRKITANRVVHLLLNKLYGQYPVPADRRIRLENIVDAFYQRFLKPKHPTELLDGFGASLAGKHLQIWMSDEQEQSFIERMDWDGAIEKATGDYLYVVEQNVGGNKLDYFEHQAHRMDVRIEGDDARVSTTVAVTNDVFLPQPRYILGDSGPLHVPMLNVYVPGNAQLLRGEVLAGRRNDIAAQGLTAWENGRPAQHTEKGKKVWSVTLEVPPRRRGAVRYDYRVPGAVRTEGERKIYELQVQHQPKVFPADLRVSLTLPDGARAIEARGWDRRGDTFVFERSLEKDTELEVSWSE